MSLATWNHRPPCFQSVLLDFALCMPVLATLSVEQGRGLVAKPRGLFVVELVLLYAFDRVVQELAGCLSIACLDMHNREKRIPLDRHVLLVSGRSSFEIVQKAMAAGVALVASVSAASSLAVELAESGGVTLVGFLRGSRMNVYAHRQRVRFG